MYVKGSIQCLFETYYPAQCLLSIVQRYHYTVLAWDSANKMMVMMIGVCLVWAGGVGVFVEHCVTNHLFHRFICVSKVMFYSHSFTRTWAHTRRRQPTVGLFYFSCVACIRNEHIQFALATRSPVYRIKTFPRRHILHIAVSQPLYCVVAFLEKRSGPVMDVTSVGVVWVWYRNDSCVPWSLETSCLQPVTHDVMLLRDADAVLLLLLMLLTMMSNSQSTELPNSHTDGDKCNKHYRLTQSKASTIISSYYHHRAALHLQKNNRNISTIKANVKNWRYKQLYFSKYDIRKCVCNSIHFLNRINEHRIRSEKRKCKMYKKSAHMTTSKPNVAPN